ncbi:activating transcription factor-2 isoform 2-T2 [Cochliomyia hominivorax]
MSFHNDEEDDADKDTGMLLNLSQKSGIFVADQTPTPTRLIKNCEEVGLFEDLRNVNPFDETFRRACEQNVQHTPGSHQTFHNDENSLHTPQVFPQFDTAVEGGIVAGEDLTKQTLDTPVVLDVESVENILDVPQTCSKPKSAEPLAPKYRAIAEKPANNSVTQQSQSGITIIPSTLQFIQPQVITVTFPNPSNETANNIQKQQIQPQQQQQQHNYNIQTKKSLAKTKKPLILPKLSTTNITPTKDSIVSNTSGCSSTTSNQSTPHPEPSSASLTPTSQLPIKERLKAILNQSSKSRPAEWSDKSSCNTKSLNRTTKSKCSKDDTMERRRAASTRYRHKMRNEYKELRKRNTELQQENDKLKERIKQLEMENNKLKAASMQPVLASPALSNLGVPAQIQIPASTIHLVMNIPKLVVPCGTNDLNTPSPLPC